MRAPNLFQSVVGRDAQGAINTAIWIALVLSVLLFGYAAHQLFSTARANDAVRKLLQRQDVAIDLNSASPQEILARINESVRRDKIDEAQGMLSSAETALPPDVRARALYNIANARTRIAAEAVRKGDIDGAAALINIAKSEYRLALKLDPKDWDTRYNLDIAMRIVRDLPQNESDDKESPEGAKKLWTDIPGTPRGLP